MGRSVGAELFPQFSEKEREATCACPQMQNKNSLAFAALNSGSIAQQGT